MTLKDITYDSRVEERNSLLSGIGQLETKMRAFMDSWVFKDYFFGFLFYRFLSEKIEPTLIEKGITIDSFEKLRSNQTNIDSIIKKSVETFGYFIEPELLYKNIIKNNLEDPNLMGIVQKAFDDLIKSTLLNETSRKLFANLYDAVILRNLGPTVSSINTSLKRILTTISSMELGKLGESSVDFFGDAYDYLLSIYAKQNGKTGGTYFTPQEVGEVLTKLTLIDYKDPKRKYKNNVYKVYDPACGSGSLLLKFSKLTGHEKEMNYYGQDLNPTMFNMARMNMILNGVNFHRIHIKREDTLLNPEYFDDRPYDAIVANPPFSIPWRGDGENDNQLLNDERFRGPGVLAPKSKADWAFALHMLNEISDEGTIATVMSQGIFFRSGAESKIREYLIEKNYIQAIVELPEDLFFGTGITANILVMRKNRTPEEKIRFVDASHLFIRSDNQNILKKEHINEIVELSTKTYDETDYPEYVKDITLDEIRIKKYDLKISNYIPKKIEFDQIDINNLNRELKETTERVDSLRESVDELLISLDKGVYNVK